MSSFRFVEEERAVAVPARGVGLRLTEFPARCIPPDMRLVWAALVVAGCSSKGSKEGAGARAAAPAPPPAADAVCSADRWCWELPRMQGNALLAALAIARDDVWAVGEHGTILHFDGIAWRPVASPTTFDLRGLWAASARDLWAVGSDGNRPVILRGDGTTWRTVVMPALEYPAPAYDGVWGSGPDDVWIVGHGGQILHWDGTALREVPSGVNEYLHGVWGTGPDDVIAVGDGGRILHWDGATWERVGGTSYDLTGIRDGWITGDDATVMRWTGRGVEPVHRDFEGPVLGTALAIGDDLWIPQTSYDRPWRRVGDRFEDVDALGGHTVEAFAAAAPDDVWAVGGGGFIARWNGTAWSVVHEDITPSSIAIGAEVWAAGYRDVHRLDAGGWREVRDDDGLGPVFALGAHAWMPRQGSVVHWDGARWREELVSDEGWPSRVWASAPDDVWATAMGGVVHHFDGKRWSSLVVDPEEKTLGAIWGSGPGDIWAAAGRRLYRYDGRAWTAVELAVDDDVVALHGTGPGDVWAVTWDAVLRWDGAGWRRALEEEGAMFTAIHAIAPDRVLVGDYHGRIRRWNGDTWTSEESGTGCEIRAIAAGAGAVWASGPCGLLRKLDPR